MNAALRLWRWCAITAACLTGCASVDPDPLWATRAIPAVEAGAFVVPAALECGWDASSEPAAIRGGDRVLVGMRILEGDSTRVWFIAITVLDPAAQSYTTKYGDVHDMADLEVIVHDHAGTVIGRDVVRVSVVDLKHGLVRPCLPEVRAAESANVWEAAGRGREAFPPSILGSLALRNFLGVVRKSAPLNELLLAFVQKPSLWSIVTNMAIKVSLQTQFDRAEVVHESGTAHTLSAGYLAPRFAIPFELSVNETPAMRSKLYVTEPVSPLTLCAGVVAVAAHHPRDPERRLDLRVLGARRGTD